jgi:hypothetical protein
MSTFGVEMFHVIHDIVTMDNGPLSLMA